MMKRIYLDNASSTPVDPAVLETMRTAYLEFPGNPSSMHSDGTRAKTAMEEARSELALMLNARPDELYFTSGGTEANNWALKGYALANRGKGNRILISSIEHDCVLNASRWLEQQGFEVTFLPVGGDGIVDPDTVAGSITADTIMVSVMHVNNELGTIQPVRDIARIAAEHQVCFHTDACQSFGKIDLDAGDSGVTMISLNAHKIYGPRGIGALYIRKGTRIQPLLHGGGQERGLRSTTENLPAIMAFARAAALCREHREDEQKRISGLCGMLVKRLTDMFDHVYFNGDPEQRVPGILNFSFSGEEGETIRLLLMLDEEGISVSTGSVCSSNHADAGGSHVMQAIGRNPVEARGAIRVSIGRFNTEDDVEMFCRALSAIAAKLHPIYSY